MFYKTEIPFVLEIKVTRKNVQFNETDQPLMMAKVTNLEN